ncbi:MAG: hypothetical protein ABIO81_13385 [Ginsengibacter sp.]
MITVTANSFHEKLHIEGDEITLNGPPSFLTGTVFLSNKESETLFIRDLPLMQTEKGEGAPSIQQSFKLLTSLRGGEQRMQRVSHQVSPSTPPGIYESIVEVGGQQKKLKMIIQPNIEIEMYPLSFHFDGVAPGKSYETQITFTNTGNIPFKIPDIKHVNAFDEDYLCRATSLAIREKGGEGYIATMDQLTKNVHDEMAGWAFVNLEESGRTVEPGEAIQLHFKLTLPENVDSGRDYFGSVRLWNKMLNYNIKSQ